MLSEQQRREFDEFGLVRLGNVFSPTDAARMCESLWKVLGREHGIQRDAPATWTVEEPRHLQKLRRGVFDPVCSAVLAQAADDLLGAGTWQRPSNGGVPLVTFPRHGAEWNVPHQRWHMDWPAHGPAQPLCSLQVVAFLAPTPARGGGTLVVTGSHRLVERLVADKQRIIHSRIARTKLMRAHPWFRALASKEELTDRIKQFMIEGTEIHGVPVRVVELTGDAGEATLLHPWLFHAAAPNCGTAPRMMLSYSLQTARSLALYGSGGGRREAEGE